MAEEEKTEITDITQTIVSAEEATGIGDYKRIPKDNQKGIIEKTNEIIPSPQEKMEAGVPTSSFEANSSSNSTSYAENFTTQDLVSYNNIISELRSDRAVMAIEGASNLASKAIESAMLVTAGWEAIKSQYSKEGLMELWEAIQDCTLNTVKQYGINKVTQLTADVATLAADSVSYLATRTAYWTSYCTAEIMEELTLSEIMKTEEIKLDLNKQTAKAQKKASDLMQTQAKFTYTIQKVNDKVNKIADKIQCGVSYAVEGPDILLKFLDSTMDVGMNEVDKYYEQGYKEAKDFLFNETDKLANTTGKQLSDKVTLPIKKELQEAMNQIFILKAKAITKAAAAAAVAISKIAALVGL